MFPSWFYRAQRVIQEGSDDSQMKEASSENSLGKKYRVIRESLTRLEPWDGTDAKNVVTMGLARTTTSQRSRLAKCYIPHYGIERPAQRITRK